MEQNPTKKCPQCQSDISPLAKICPNCKSDVRPKKPIVKYLLIFVVVIIGINIFAYDNAGTPAPSTSKPAVENPLDWAAFFAQLHIKSSLKSPTTAEFPRIEATYLGDGLYGVSSYVDSQNSYGAMIRSSWEVTLRYSGGNAEEQTNWKLEKVVFDGEVTYKSKG